MERLETKEFPLMALRYDIIPKTSYHGLLRLSIAQEATAVKLYAVSRYVARCGILSKWPHVWSISRSCCTYSTLLPDCATRLGAA